MDIYKRVCKHCGIAIEGRINKLFCSRTCKQLNKIKPYSKHKKDYCEKCNFIPIHSCQLDVDHIDGDRTNNNLENLQTLCANCHRLKTQFQKDNVNVKKRRNLSSSFVCLQITH